MFVWVTLPKGFDGASLLAKAVRDHRIAFVPGKAFHADGTGENTIRLSFSCASDEAIETGISRLGTLIKRVNAGLTSSAHQISTGMPLKFGPR